MIIKFLAFVFPSPQFANTPKVFFYCFHNEIDFKIRIACIKSPPALLVASSLE